MPFSHELSAVCQLLIPLSGKQDQLAWALPSVHSWGLPRASGALRAPQKPWVFSILLPAPCYLGQFSSILPNGQPSFKQLAIKEALLVSAGLVRTTENKH